MPCPSLRAPPAAYLLVEFVVAHIVMGVERLFGDKDAMPFPDLKQDGGLARSHRYSTGFQKSPKIIYIHPELTVIQTQYDWAVSVWLKA